MVRSKYIYRGKVVTLRIDTTETPDGRQISREVVEHHGAVAIVPRLDNDHILLIKQFRQAAGEVLLEIPAGTLEDGENPDECAARELEEETGFRAEQIEPMFSQYLAPGYSNEVLHVYRAAHLSKTATHFDEDEDIELVPILMTDVDDMILSGKIRDAKTIAALLVAVRLWDKEKS